MIFVFVPYYEKWDSSFDECLNKQSIKFYLTKYNRKEMNDHWSHSCNHYLKQIKRIRGIDKDDVICIMNNDIVFGNNLFSEGVSVKKGEILIPEGNQIEIDWKEKRFMSGSRIDTFAGRTFFMNIEDFKNSGGFSRLLPHYLSDYDFGIRMIKKGMKVRIMKQSISHTDHPKNLDFWHLHSANNPLFWAIFLFKHGLNKYLFINLLKIWGK